MRKIRMALLAVALAAATLGLSGCYYYGGGCGPCGPGYGARSTSIPAGSTMATTAMGMGIVIELRSERRNCAKAHPQITQIFTDRRERGPRWIQRSHILKHVRNVNLCYLRNLWIANMCS